MALKRKVFRTATAADAYERRQAAKARKEGKPYAVFPLSQVPLGRRYGWELTWSTDPAPKRSPVGTLPNPLFRQSARKEVSLDDIRDLQKEESTSLCQHQDFARAKRVIKQRPASYARARGLRLEKKDREQERIGLLRRLAMKRNPKPRSRALDQIVVVGDSLNGYYVTRLQGPYHTHLKGPIFDKKTAESAAKQYRAEEKQRREANPPRKFIASAIRRPGALHRKLGVPEGEKIPVSRIRRAISHPEEFVRGAAQERLLQQEARFALTLEGRKQNPAEFGGFHFVGYHNGRIVGVHDDARLRTHLEVVEEAERLSQKWEADVFAYPIHFGAPGARIEARVAFKSKPNPRRHRNGDDESPESAESLYTSFHGRGPNRIGTYDVPTGIPSSVAELGALLKIKIIGSGRMLQQLTWEPDEGVKLAADPDSESLYIIGDKQRLPANCLENLESEFGDSARKDQFIIGTIKEITYRTQKGFDKYETIDYYHELGEETGERPLLVYDRHNHRLLIVGGAYTVKPEGITN